MKDGSGPLGGELQDHPQTARRCVAIGSQVVTPVTGVTEPNVCAATITMPPNTPLGSWSFKIKQARAADFRSLTKNLIGDLVLLVNYDAS